MKIKDIFETHQSASQGGQMSLTAPQKKSDAEAGLKSEQQFVANVIGQVRNHAKNRNVDLNNELLSQVKEIAKTKYKNSKEEQDAVNDALRLF